MFREKNICKIILVIALIVVLVIKSGNNQPGQDKNTVEEGNPSVYGVHRGKGFCI